MIIVRQIIADSWTGNGPVSRRAIEIQDGKIISVRPARETPVLPDALVFNNGELLIPGLHDAHLHLLMGGLFMQLCDFHGISTKEQFQDHLKDFLNQRDEDKSVWIEGKRLNQELLTITRTDIDKVCPDTPVFIWCQDLHSGVCNSVALIKAGVHNQIKDPEAGRFERDESKILNGVLRESAAHVVHQVIPEADDALSRKALLAGQQLALSYGFTAASASVREGYLPHYLSLADKSGQKIRLNIWSVSHEFDFEKDHFEKQESDMFRRMTFKGFTDGALGSRTAAMWNDYADDPGNTGILSIREGPLARFIRSAHKEGYSVALHAIGDRANSVSLDAFEMAGSGGIGPELRPRIEHVQHLRERDFERFAKLGVIASMQPIHCTSDMKNAEKRLGIERAKRTHAWKSLLDHDAILAFGSDWPVEDMSPFAGIHAAVTRQTANGDPVGGWIPEQKITAAEALQAYTHGAAYAAKWEDKMGTIESGKFADLTVISKNILDCRPEDILKTEALRTIIGGEIVYEKK